MEALYLASIAARDAGQRRIPVHVFPCRMDSVSCHLSMANAMLDDPALGHFWTDQLLPGFLAFERTHQAPKVRIQNSTYVVTARGRPRT